MKETAWKCTAIAVLAAAAIYLGNLAATAQDASKTDPNAAKLEEIAKKLDDLSKKVDDLSKKLDTVGADVAFIKARGKG